MKAVMLSIQPRHCENICTVVGEKNGKSVYKKTIEVRKTAPKCNAPFKCYIYCTLSGCKEFAQEDLLRWGKGKWYDKKGKVIGEFMCDWIEKLKYNFDGYGDEWHEWNDEFVHYEDMCLSEKELEDYLGQSNGYAWHISDLKIYDMPKELREFRKVCAQYGSDDPLCDNCRYFIDCRTYEYDESDCAFAGRPPLTRPPQSWCYVEEQ